MKFRTVLFILSVTMNLLLRMSLAALALAAVSGCASKKNTPLFHAGDETPPEFLSGPVAALLTNLDGFSATLTAGVPQLAGVGHTVSGDLLEREGRLIFQPAAPVKGKKARMAAGMFFIWREDNHDGFVCSDALQGYAPVSASSVPTNVVLDASTAAEDQANGHPCRRLDALVESSDGSSARFHVWQAEDAKKFPVRIVSASGPNGLTLNFTDVHLDLPAPELFYPPDGFTRYATPVALMNELILRQTAVSKSPGHVELGEPVPAIGPANWRQPTPQ
ncbi:MAG: hypothetical protein ABSG59_08865 [Verrucomicrobiota bacterium]